MIMDEIDDRRWDHDRSRTTPRNKQSSQGRPSQRDEVSRDPFQWIHYNQVIICVSIQVPQQIEASKLLEMIYNQRDSQLVMIQEIITEAPKLLVMFCD
jgi:hypothetical protein